MKIQVLQGERELARDNWSLGTFELEFAPAPKGVPRVGVQFEIDANGILSVLARDVKTGHQKIVQLKSAVDVRDEDVEKMVAESVEYAFDDLAQRQWIETKRKSGDMLGATRKALAQVGAQIVPEEVKEIEALMHKVEKALESENLAELKAANAALDQGHDRAGRFCHGSGDGRAAAQERACSAMSRRMLPRRRLPRQSPIRLRQRARKAVFRSKGTRFRGGYWRKPCAIGTRRPMPKARGETLSPGAAWRRLYSLKTILLSTSRTSSGEMPSLTSILGSASSTT